MRGGVVEEARGRGSPVRGGGGVKKREVGKGVL